MTVCIINVDYKRISMDYELEMKCGVVRNALVMANAVATAVLLCLLLYVRFKHWQTARSKFCYWMPSQQILRESR